MGTLNNKIEGIYQLTPMQEGILYHHILQPDSSNYILQNAIKFNGNLKEEIIVRSLECLSKKYDALRGLIFYKKTKTPKFVILKERQIELSVFDLSGQTDSNAYIKQIKETDIKKKFDFEKDSLLRVTFIKLSDSENIMLWSGHHIILDGWCISILFNDFIKFYKIIMQQISKNQLDNLVEQEKKKTTSYGQYLNYLAKKKNVDAMKYWKKMLSDYTEFVTIPSICAESKKGGSVNKEVCGFTRELTEKIHQFAVSKNVTFSSVIEMAWGILLAKYNDILDVVFGKVVSGRNIELRGIDQAVGLFINTIPSRILIDENSTYQTLVERVQEQFVKSSDYDFCSLAEIQSMTQNKNGLFDTIFVFENFYVDEDANVEIDQLSYEIEDEREETNYGITLICYRKESLTFKILYKEGEYRQDEIKAILERMQFICQRIVDEPEEKIVNVELVLQEERKKILYDFNNTDKPYPEDKTIVDLFEEQVKLCPDEIAVVYKDDSITFQELNEKVNALACELRRKGVDRNTFVGIAAKRSIEMIISIYAIVKSGGAYVPIDPEYPQERIKYILEDSKISILICCHTDMICSESIEKIVLSDYRKLKSGVDNLAHVNQAGDLLYIIYTSGTTGKPKGVMCHHTGLINRVLWMNSKYPLTREDVILQKTTFTFDVSVWEIFWWAIIGCQVVMLEQGDEKSSLAICDAIQKHKVTTMHFVPSMLNMFLVFLKEHMDICNKLHSLRNVFASGEALLPAQVKLFYKIAGSLGNKVQLSNFYGPTEASIDVTYYQCTGEENIIPIGRAIDNIKLYIMNNGKLCGIGVVGELCIAGVGVAKGYLNKPELTAKKFLDNPFGSGKLYSTGDRARWLPDGNIEYLGRMDDQVKIRGFRIELGEVESRIRELEEIDECAVIVRTDKSGDKSINAYFTSHKNLEIAKLKQRLAEKLPQYMVPTYMMQIDIIPVTPNGKLNKSALPDIEVKSVNDFAAPGNETEKIICSIFSLILGNQKVGIYDSFFELGGHSLRATRLVNAIEAELGIRIAIKDIFSHETPEKLASLIRNNEEYHSITKAKEQEFYEMSAAQKRIYLIYRMQPDSIAYNMTTSLRLAGEVHPEKIRSVLQQMKERHEILRTQFMLKDGKAVQKVLDTVNIDFEVEESSVKSDEVLIREFVKPFKLENAQVLRAKIVQKGAYSLFLIDIHHIACDGMSEGIFIREFNVLYNGKKLSPLKLQYKDYVEWTGSKDISSQKDFWRDIFREDVPVLNMPLDYPRPFQQSYDGDSFRAEIGNELFEKVKLLSKKTNTTEYMIFLTALMIVLSKYSKQEDIVVGSPISGRTHKDTECMIGMFVNTLAFRGRPKGDKNVLSFLNEVKEICLKAYENQEYPFEELVDFVSIKREISRNPLFDCMLILQNNEHASIVMDGISVESVQSYNLIAKFDLAFVIEEDSNQYVMTLEYCSALFKKETIEFITRHYIETLKTITENLQAKISEISMIGVREKEQILVDFNASEAEYQKNMTAIELFEEQVFKQPDSTAIVYEDKKLTYKELNRAVNVLAHKLRQNGIKPDDFVVVLTERSIEMVIAVLGVIKSGGAYVPIDPTYPQDRIKYMVKDCKAKAIVKYCKNDTVVNESEITVFDLAHCDWDKESGENPECINKISDLMYCIYTSGTTGRPKGVMVEHHGVTNLKKFFESKFQITSSDRVAQFANYIFDASVWEMTMALLCGAKLVIVPAQIARNPEMFSDYCRSHGVSVATLPPNYYAQDGVNVDLRLLITAGSESSAAVLNKAENMIYVNAYGPTETTVCATYWEKNSNIIKQQITIGKPITNTQIYILDKEKLCGIGVPGELCIAGAGIARGYLNQLELTDMKFIDNPFGAGKIYRSGDLARWLPDGNIEYLGRIDEQVKIRGYRIELGEIEAVLMQIEGVRECTVIARRGENGEKEICAYYTGMKEIEITAIKSKLREMLPEYMIPAYMMQIEAIPVTGSGKVDTKQLPEMEKHSDSIYAAPVNEMEQVICDVFQSVLKVKKIGVMDNFFELGGDSLKVIQLQSMVRDRGYQLSITDVFSQKIPKNIAYYLTRQQDKLQKDCVSGEIPLGPMQEVFLDWDVEEANHFNMSLLLECNSSINLIHMEAAVEAVVSHHDMLRAHFDKERQMIASVKEHINCLHLKETEENILLTEINKIQNSLNLEKGEVFKITVLRTAECDYVHLCVHHFVSDAISLRIIAEDVIKAYMQRKYTAMIHLPKKTDTYKEWVESEADIRLSDEEFIYWENINREIESLSSKKNKRGPVKLYEYTLKEESAESFIYEFSRIKGTSLHNVMLALVLSAVSTWSGQRKVALSLESHGRFDYANSRYVDRTVGWFTKIYPVIIESENNLSHDLDAVDQLFEKLPNKGMYYLKYYNEKKQKGESLFSPDISFNFFGDETGTESLDYTDFMVSAKDSGENISHKNFLGSHLSINISSQNGLFDVSILANWECYKEGDVKALFHLIEENCEKVAQEVKNQAKNKNKATSSKRNADMMKIKEEREQYIQSVVKSSTKFSVPLDTVQKFSFYLGIRETMIKVPVFGFLDVNIFQKAWIKLVDEFPFLRCSIDLQNSDIHIWGTEKNKCLPFVDLSDLHKDEQRQMFHNIMESMQIYEDGKSYSDAMLAAIGVIIKMSEKYSILLLSATHLVFERFSATVFCQKLLTYYYELLDGNEIHPSQTEINLCNLQSNENAITREFDDLLKKFGQAVLNFYRNYSGRETLAYTYHYFNEKRWNLLNEEQKKYTAENAFRKWMFLSLPNEDIPMLAITMARQFKDYNYFDCIGEFLDVFPIIIGEQKPDIAEQEEQIKRYSSSHNLLIAPLLFNDKINIGYAGLEKLRNEIRKGKLTIPLFNYVGLFHDSDDLIISIERKRNLLNITDAIEEMSGFRMNIFAYSQVDYEQLEKELNIYINGLIDEITAKRR